MNIRWWYLARVAATAFCIFLSAVIALALFAGVVWLIMSDWGSWIILGFVFIFVFGGIAWITVDEADKKDKPVWKHVLGR